MGYPQSVKIPNGYVYILQADNRQVYKIGITNNPERRMKVYKNSRKKPNYNVEFIAFRFYDDYQSAENYWHRYFAKLQLIGEWFLLTPEDIQYFKDSK